MSTSIPTSRTAYDDLPDADQLRDDCEVAEHALDLTVPARDAARPAPAIRFEEKPADGVLAAAQLLAQALNLE